MSSAEGKREKKLSKGNIISVSLEKIISTVTKDLGENILAWIMNECVRGTNEEKRHVKYKRSF